MVGSIMWLATATRPDIACASSVLGQFNACPTEKHVKAAKRVIRYLKGTSNAALLVGDCGRTVLEGWCDADYAGDLDTRRSTSGYVFKLFGSAISWSSIRQPTVALSTCEAEYMTLTEATKEAIYLRRLLTELGVMNNAATVTIRCDNQGAIAFSHNPHHHRRTKHIDIRHHFIRDAIIDGSVTVEYVETREQTAGIFTKGLAGPLHGEHCGGLGLEQ